MLPGFRQYTCRIIYEGGMMRSKRASIRFIENSYKLYEQKMYQVAYSVLHDQGLAEDAVQEAFVKLMKHNVYFEDLESDECKRYMITVIKHSSIDIYNKKRKEREIVYLSAEDADIKDIPVQDDADGINNIEEIISSLPEKYYLVVNCLAVKNLSVKETALELGITEANVRKRFERAKLMLKNLVKGSGEYETGSKLHKPEAV